MCPSADDGAYFTHITPEILGTKVGDLIEPCPNYPASSRPDPPDAGFPIALAISGGGFRATLAGIGVLRFLADAGLLGQVRYVSSVSGGSIANGLLATHYQKLAADRFSARAFADLVEEPTIARISGASLTSKMLRNAWRIIGPKTRTNLLADSFDEWFFGGLKLHELPPPCRYVFNAANLTTGVRFGFEREWTGDYVLGRLPSEAFGLRVADAVAASAAVPGLLATYTPKGPALPCQNGRVPKLVDGGAYENTAMEPVDRLPDVFLIAVNAGGIFRTGPIGWMPIVRDLQRAEGLLYRQSTALRMKDMVERFRLREDAVRAGQQVPPGGRWGVLFGLGTTLVPGPGWQEAPLPRTRQLQLAQLSTSFSKFERGDCQDLVRHAWWLTGATIATYHPDLLATLPAWGDRA